MLSGGSALLLWIVLGGLVAGLPVGAFVSLPSEFLRPESRGTGLDVFFSIYYLGCALLSGAAGAVYDFTARARATLWLAADLAFDCVPALLLVRRAQHRAKAM